MSIGIQPNITTLNSALGQYVIALRNDFQAIQNLESYLAAQPGGASAFLQSLGMTSADAAVFVSTLANHDQLRQVYQGLIAQPAAFNYEANGNLAWGGS